MGIGRLIVAIITFFALTAAFFVAIRYTRAYQFPAVNSALNSNKELTLLQYLTETRKYEGTYCTGVLSGFWGNFSFHEYVSGGIVRFDFEYPDRTSLHEILNEEGLYAWNDNLNVGYKLNLVDLVPHKGPLLKQDISFINGAYGCAPLWFANETLFEVPQDRIYKAYPVT